MLRRALIVVAVSLFVVGCDGEATKVPLLVNILKGTTRSDDKDVTHPTKDDLNKAISDSVKGANDILKGAGIELTFDPSKDVQEVDNPDGSGGAEMDAKYDKDKLDKVDKATDAELKKKFGDPKKGFKVYIAFAIKNLAAGENGVSYSSLQPPDPGFSIVEAGALEARLLAHEIGHGLGCLDDTDRKGALMNPKGTKDDKNLTDDEKKKAKDCAEKRAK